MFLELPMLAQEPVEGGNPEGVKMLKKDRSQNKANALKIRPNYYVVGLNLGGYTQCVRWRAPTKKKLQGKKRKKTYQNGALQVARPLHLGLGEGLKPLRPAS